MEIISLINIINAVGNHYQSFISSYKPFDAESSEKLLIFMYFSLLESAESSYELSYESYPSIYYPPFYYIIFRVCNLKRPR